MQDPTPTLDEWRRLYQAALELKKRAPWEWMYEDEIFGVRNPESSEIGYVSIMGANGEHLALAVYLGSEGLDGFWLMESGEASDAPTVLLEVPQLQASFEDQEMIEKQDRKVMKALGYKFRGRQAWPQFRSYRPGCGPWFLSAAEARFLAIAIEQALDVVARLEADPELLDSPGDEDEYLVRVQTKQGWEDQWLAPDLVSMPPPPAVDTKRLEKMRQERSRGPLTLEADLFALPTFIQNEPNTRPYIPYTLMVVEADSGFIVGVELLIAEPSLDAVWAQIAPKFLDTLEKLEALPFRLAVSDERLQNILMPIAAGLGIRLQATDELPALDEARAALTHMQGWRG